MTTLRFKLLRWLRRPHRNATRLSLAGCAWVSVMMLTGRYILASDAANLFATDDFKTGAHRIAWYLHHGWTGKLMRSAVPLFDPTTAMSPKAVIALDQWLTGKSTRRHRLALLNVRAHQIITITDAAEPTAVMNDFIRIANGLVSHMQPPEADVPVQPKKTPEFRIAQARQALVALGAIKMPWYIMSGTLLGAVREGTFLAHDYDIDIGINAENFDAAAFHAQIQASSDLVLVASSTYLELKKDNTGLLEAPRPALYQLMHADGVGIDVFVHYRQGPLLWHGSAKHRWSNSTFDLADYTIAGLNVRGPADADRYLTENYGDWRTPNAQFNCSLDTPNVSFPRNPVAVVQNLNIALLQSGNPAWIAQIILWQEKYLQIDPDTVSTVFVFP